MNKYCFRKIYNVSTLYLSCAKNILIDNFQNENHKITDICDICYILCIFFFWSLEISENILRNQKFIYVKTHVF